MLKNGLMLVNLLWIFIRLTLCFCTPRKHLLLNKVWQETNMSGQKCQIYWCTAWWAFDLEPGPGSITLHNFLENLPEFLECSLIRYFLPIYVLKSLYYAMFFQFLQYGIAVWGLTYPTYLQLPLFILQKWQLWHIVLCQITQIHYSAIWNHCNYQLLLFVSDCVNHTTPDYFSDYFRHVSDVHSFCTRHAIRDDLFLERRHITQYGIRSVQYSGAKLWNSIPVELKSRKFTLMQVQHWMGPLINMQKSALFAIVG